MQVSEVRCDRCGAKVDVYTRMRLEGVPAERGTDARTFDLCPECAKAVAKCAMGDSFRCSGCKWCRKDVPFWDRGVEGRVMRVCVKGMREARLLCVDAGDPLRNDDRFSHVGPDDFCSFGEPADA
jgi:hypothetical protein